MKQKFILSVLVLGLTVLVGCTSHRITMPQMDLPPEPQKPAIKTVIVPYQNDFIVGYPLKDSLRLYEFLLRKDSYEEKLRYRIESMNEIMQGKQ